MSIDSEHLREQLGLYARISETTQLPTIFADGLAAESPVVFANEAFLTLSGKVASGTLGQPLEALLCDVVGPANLSAVEQQLLSAESAMWEMPCQCVDNSEFKAVVFYNPVTDRQGSVHYHSFNFVLAGGDDESLLDQRNAMHALYAHAPGFIATSTGPDHRFSFANDSYRRFVARDNLLGRTVVEALPELVEQGFLRILDDVYNTGEPYRGTGVPMGIFVPETNAIDVRYCDFVYQPVRNANGKITGLFCEGYDVTEQRKTASKLSMLQAEIIHVSRVNAMGTMATTLAHELNHPLAAIANFAAGLRRLADIGPPDQEKLQLALRGIEEAAHTAADIIRNVRELTRRKEPERYRFDLNEAAGECIRLVQATIPPCITIHKKIAPNMNMAADRVQIQQVIINLLRNACDAVLVAPVKDVEIFAEISDASIVVCIADTGPGVPMEVAQRMFSWSETSKHGGMGLGLAISRTIIEAHHGRIWLENSSRHGSKFCFSIPLQGTSADPTK